MYLVYSRHWKNKENQTRLLLSQSLVVHVNYSVGSYFETNRKSNKHVQCDDLSPRYMAIFTISKFLYCMLLVMFYNNSSSVFNSNVCKTVILELF